MQARVESESLSATLPLLPCCCCSCCALSPLSFSISHLTSRNINRHRLSPALSLFFISACPIHSHRSVQSHLPVQELPVPAKSSELIFEHGHCCKPLVHLLICAHSSSQPPAASLFSSHLSTHQSFKPRPVFTLFGTWFLSSRLIFRATEVSKQTLHSFHHCLFVAIIDRLLRLPSASTIVIDPYLHQYRYRLNRSSSQP